MLSCPNKNDPRWKQMVDALGENEAYYYFNLNDGFMSGESMSEISMSLSPSQNRIDVVDALEFDETYWKNLYANTSNKNKYTNDIITNNIPGITNKYQIDNYNVYHGADFVKIDENGNLILSPSKNFGDKTTSISFTQVPVVAQRYALEANGNTIIKINNTAIGNNYTAEDAEEIALNTSKDLIIPKGRYEILQFKSSNDAAVKQRMERKYASQVEEYENVILNSPDILTLLRNGISEDVAYDNEEEFAEYSRNNEDNKDTPPDWYRSDSYLKAVAGRSAVAKAAKNISKQFIIDKFSEYLIEKTKKYKRAFRDIEGVIDNDFQIEPNTPHATDLFYRLTQKINATEQDKADIIKAITLNVRRAEKSITFKSQEEIDKVEKLEDDYKKALAALAQLYKSRESDSKIDALKITINELKARLQWEEIIDMEKKAESEAYDIIAKNADIEEKLYYSTVKKAIGDEIPKEIWDSLSKEEQTKVINCL